MRRRSVSDNRDYHICSQSHTHTRHTIHISCFSYIFQSMQFTPHILYHFYISYHYNSHLVFHAIHAILIIHCTSSHISYNHFISILPVISYTSFRILFLLDQYGECHSVLLLLFHLTFILPVHSFI